MTDLLERLPRRHRTRLAYCPSPGLFVVGPGIRYISSSSSNPDPDILDQLKSRYVGAGVVADDADG